MFVLYTKNDCPYCDVMKEKLAKWSVPYITVNIEEKPEAKTFLKENGFRTVPQLMIEETSLNDGIDTREFTMDDLLNRLDEYHFNRDSGITPEITEWANGVIEGIKNESKS